MERRASKPGTGLVRTESAARTSGRLV